VKAPEQLAVMDYAKVGMARIVTIVLLTAMAGQPESRHLGSRVALLTVVAPAAMLALWNQFLPPVAVMGCVNLARLKAIVSQTARDRHQLPRLRRHQLHLLRASLAQAPAPRIANAAV